LGIGLDNVGHDTNSQGFEVRNLNNYAAMCALGWLIVATLKQAPGRIHWTVIGYLVSQILFIGSTQWACWRIGRLAPDTDEYKLFYGLAAILPIVFMVAIAGRHSMEHGRFYGVVSIAVCGLFSIWLDMLLGSYTRRVFHLDSLTPVIRNHFILASVLLAAGCATLLSLAAPSGDIECAIRVGLGLLWTLDGAYRFAYAISMVQPHLRTVARFDWVPIALALVMAVGLAHKLNSSQRELSRQALPDLQVMEQVVEEPIYE
jgi:hypothetical protein